MRRVLFIINPISGGGKAKRFLKYIKRNKDNLEISFDIIFTKPDLSVEDNLKLVSLDNWDIVIAAGGDGTINETSSAIINKNILLGIIPLGSGNGLARHLKIPLNPVKALSKILNGRAREIDIGYFNNKPFINMAGIGFDGYVSGLFAGSRKRGIQTYAQCVLKALSHFKPRRYILEIDGEKFYHEAYLIAFANSKQYGSNFFIAPYGSLVDGVIDITVINKVNLLHVPRLALALRTRNLNKLPFVSMYKGRSIKVFDLDNEYGHVDGEPLVTHGDLNINVKSSQIKIIV